MLLTKFEGRRIHIDVVKCVPRGDPGWGLLMELPGNE